MCTCTCLEGVAAVEVVGGRAERDEREKWAGDVDRTIPPEPGLWRREISIPIKLPFI